MPTLRTSRASCAWPARRPDSRAHPVSGVDQHADEVSEPRIRIAEYLRTGLQYQKSAAVADPLGSSLQRVAVATGPRCLLDSLLLDTESDDEAVDQRVRADRSEAGLARATDYGAASTVRLAGDGDLGADAEAIAAALGGTAPSPVLDYVWGAPAEPVFRSLGRQGLDEDEGDTAYVQIGALAGPDATVPPSLLRSRRIRISGSGAGSASIGEIMEQLPVYMQRIADGLVTVPARAVPLRQAADAWLAAENGGDRVVVVPD
jgi:hypothetical protein